MSNTEPKKKKKGNIPIEKSLGLKNSHIAKLTYSEEPVGLGLRLGGKYTIYTQETTNKNGTTKKGKSILRFGSSVESIFT